tara:strand:+ start:2105 stop:2986 length:882 start_codon:yes stop_codon:yes gene_type:complete
VKIALLLCGQTRTFLDKRVLNLQNRFIEFYNLDVFVSTWKNSGVSVYDLFINNSTEQDDKEISKSDYDHLQNLKSININSFEDFVKNSKDSETKERMKIYLKTLKKGTSTYNPHRFATSYPQLYTMFDANKLKNNYEKDRGFTYDVVIKSRPDFVFYDKIDKHFENIKNSVKSINSKPDYYFPNRIFDVMFISNSHNMTKLTNSYLYFEKLIKLNLYEKFKFNYGNKIESILAKYNLNFEFLKGLEDYDCNRILYKNARNHNLIVEDIDKVLGELIKLETLSELDNLIKTKFV